MNLPNNQLHAMTAKQQIVVFSRHISKTVRCAKNAHDPKPLIRMMGKDLAVLLAANKLEAQDAVTARRCALAIERMMK